MAINMSITSYLINSLSRFKLLWTEDKVNSGLFKDGVVEVSPGSRWVAVGLGAVAR